ncbi:MAG TPA: dTMP kinase [Candidatus Nanoarchaeia archaeon]|nr:dTMP kinase [Candidatus Nanoarchaeia archaeon]
MAKAPLIVLEGMVGCGKTTQIKVVEKELIKRGIKYSIGREPGGEPTAENIRLLVKGDPNLDSIAELFLFGAARAQYVTKVLLPDLENGILRITDRYAHSMKAFQGAGRGINYDLIDIVNKYATKGLKPDITFILDVNNLEAAFLRAQQESKKTKEKDKFEDLDYNFHKRVRDEYRKMGNDINTILVPHYEDIEDIPTRIDKISNYVLSHLNPFLDKHYQRI